MKTSKRDVPVLAPGIFELLILENRQALADPPPGRVWRESPMTDRRAAARDEAYQPAQDLPEGAAAGD